MNFLSKAFFDRLHILSFKNKWRIILIDIAFFIFFIFVFNLGSTIGDMIVPPDCGAFGCSNQAEMNTMNLIFIDIPCLIITLFYFMLNILNIIKSTKKTLSVLHAVITLPYILLVFLLLI